MNGPSLAPLILVVEDDRDYIDLLERGHKRSQISCEFKFVETAESALDFLNTHSFSPNIILLDYDLPGMDGLQMVDELKKSVWKAIPILMFSIHNNPKLIEEAYRRGINAFIPKPEEYGSIVELWNTVCSFWGNYVSLPNVA